MFDTPQCKTPLVRQFLDMEVGENAVWTYSLTTALLNLLIEGLDLHFQWGGRISSMCMEDIHLESVLNRNIKEFI